MNRNDYAVLTLRGFALYAWFHTLEYFTNGVLQILLAQAARLSGINALTYAVFITAVFIPPVVFFAVGLFLFVRSRELASRLLPAPGTEPGGQPPPHPLAGASVAFAAVGVAIFLHALPIVLNPILVNIEESSAQFPKPPMSHLDIARIISAVVQLILGFALFLKSRVFAAAWWRKQQHASGE